METVGTIHRYTVEPEVTRLYGVPVYLDPEKIAPERAIGLLAHAGFEQRGFGYYVALVPTTPAGGVVDAEYPTDDPQTVTLPVRTMKSLTALPCARVYATTSTGTQVRLRVTASGGPYWWDNDEWAEATLDAHWNTPAEVEAHLADWPDTELGFVVELSTSVASVTPRFYGVLIACDYTLVASSVDPDLPASQRDDLLNRTLVGALRDGPTYSATEEFVAVGALDVIDYSGDAEGMDRAIDVANVVAVYDVTDDPKRQTPLTGIWDAGEKTYTLAAAIPDGHTAHVELTFQPPVAYTGDGDWFEESYPFIHVLAPNEVEAKTQGTIVCLVNPAGTQARVVPTPDLTTLDIIVRLVAEEPAEVESMRSAIRRYLAGSSGGRGRVLLSEATAIPVQMTWEGQVAPLDKRGDAHEEHIRLRVWRWPELHWAFDETVMKQIQWR